MPAINTLAFTLVSRAGQREARFAIENAVIGGWTSRNKAAMEKHIHELEELGVPRPASTPIYYRVGVSRLTTADTIQAAGGESSGEVEFVLVQAEGRLWVGVGSDHTDRKVETYGITVAKQMCDKPVAPMLWPMDEVAEHWDRLVLRSHAVIDGQRVPYQDGHTAAMLPPAQLMAGYTGGGALAENTLMFGGTLAAIGGIRPAQRFEFELVDEVLGRRIGHAYDIVPLPIMG